MRHTARLLLLLALAACATAPRPLTKDEALDRWAAALGGRKRLAKIDAVRREYAFTIGGVSGNQKEWTTADGRSRSETKMEGYSSVSTFDGSDGWSADGDAQPHRAGGEEAKITATNLYLDSYSMFFPGRPPGR